MKHVFAIILVLALFIPAQRPACMTRYTSGGRAVCWCKADRPGARWTTAPRLACSVWEVKPGK